MSLSNINNGLVFAASPTLPEYPDNVAGTTYFQDVFATTDNWSGTGLAANVSGGNLVLTSASTGTELVTRTASQIASNTVKIRARLVQGTITSITLGSNLGLTSQTFIPTSSFQVFNLTPVVNWSGTLSAVTLNLNGQSANCIIQIDWIYIGDGTYSSRLLDASGNGNHGTVFGCTPVAGITGRALSGDGVNDYVAFGDVAKITGALTLACWAKANIAITTGFNPIITKWNSTANQRQYRLDLANGTPRFIISQAGNAISAEVSSSSVLSAVNFEQITCVYVPSVGIYLYRNGVLSASNTTSIPSSLFNSTAVLELFRDVAALGHSNITIAEPRIYNRALTAAEIEALATNPDAYNLDQVVRSITPVPTSVMTRDINGDTQVRRLESTIATGTAPLTVASTTLVTNLNADRVDSLEGSDFVRGTGTVAQTITGVKTFSSIPVLPASDPTTVNQATRKAYIDGKLPGKITISASAPTGGTDGDIWITI
jgi:hypothetical protein